MDRTQFERLSRYLRQSLSPEESKRLEIELAENPELADQLLQLAFEETVLKDWARGRRDALTLDETAAREDSATLSLSVKTNQGGTRFLRSLIALSSLAVVLIVSSAWWMQLSEEPVAALENVSGVVELIHSDGTAEAGANGRMLTADQQVLLRGPRSSASVVYPDGSRLMLAGLSRLQLEGKAGKRIRISQGHVGAKVSKQGAAGKMHFLAPTAKLEVIGTQFSLEASADATEVSVVEGRVKLIRTSDGRSVDLSAGSQARAGTDQSDLKPVQINRPSATYDVDFEEGLPSGWQAGHAVREGTPPRAGVRAEAFEEQDGTVYGITSPKAWRDGLFSWEGNGHLNFTYKVDKPDWFQILISTRAVDKDKPPIATYRFKDERMWWPFEPDQWRTASVPLTAFGRVSDWSETPLSAGELPFELLFTSKDNNLSLVIDRIWISPDGPGTFTVREEE